VRPGDRVMIVCENCRALIALWLATLQLDAWPVLANANLSAREIDQIRDHCGARRVIYTTSVSPHATEHAKRHNAVIEPVGSVGTIGLGPVYDAAQTEPVDSDRANRVAALIYTSGTTGIPKGVMLTHRNMLFIAAVSAEIRSLAPDDRLYGILPMSHAVGLSVVLLGTLLSGATLYVTPRFDPMAARTVLEKEHITIMLGVPSMFQHFLQYAKLRGIKALSLPSLRIISSSGAPLDPSIKESVENLFGLVLHNGYGITECGPTIAQTRVTTPRRDTSVGPALPGVEIKLAGSDGDPVPDGEIGTLRVRGPNVMKGYYRAPEETAAAIDADGWFNSNDLAKLQDGALFMVGRAKDLVIRSGFNVYPVEVEAVLNGHSSVVRSAVLGRSIKGDEELIAFVQPSDTKLTTRDLAEYAAKYLAPYKRPSRIILISSMPLTPTGKIIKADLAKFAAAEGGPAITTETAVPQSV
jgi:long-chain acyl-CoA synthetase